MSVLQSRHSNADGNHPRANTSTIAFRALRREVDSGSTLPEVTPFKVHDEEAPVVMSCSPIAKKSEDTAMPDHFVFMENEIFAHCEEEL